VVACDNLGGPGPKDARVPGGTKGQKKMTIGEAGCPRVPADRKKVPITKPGLGISADYGLPPAPNTSLPDPLAKATYSLKYSKAGIDSGEVIVRGGSHLDFSWIPNQAFGASLRGPDITDWYTSAWFDKYLKHQRSADARLLTSRWRHDPIEKSVDPNHDGNAFSFYYYSRLDIHLRGGKKFDCEDLRAGCRGMVSKDGYRGNYSYFKIDTTPDKVTGPGARVRKGSHSLGPCSREQAITFHIKPYYGEPIVRAVVSVDGRRVLAKHGHSLKRVSISGLPGNKRHIVRVREYTEDQLARTATRKVYGCARRT
jgi:hypothetical protein